MGYRISEAVAMMREGKKMRRGGWSVTDPTYLVLIPGREVEASFPPMVDHLGAGTKFLVRDHVDAIYKAQTGFISADIGYQFSQADVLTQDWYEVTA